MFAVGRGAVHLLREWPTPRPLDMQGIPMVTLYWEGSRSPQQIGLHGLRKKNCHTVQITTPPLTSTAPLPTFTWLIPTHPFFVFGEGK